MITTNICQYWLCHALLYGLHRIYMYHYHAIKEVTKNLLGVFGLSFTIMSDICLYTHIYVVVPRVTVSL